MPPEDEGDLSEEDVSGIWNRIIGPVYDREGLQHGFGYTAEQIDAMVEASSILELVTSDGAAFFPASCFDAHGRPPPHLSNVITKLRDREITDPWGLIIWLSSRPPEWDGQSAIELLRTEWADEVVAQAAEHGRSPLWSRAKQAEQMAIARPILDRFAELVANLPVSVAKETLFVTRETEVPYGVFLVTLDRIKGSLQVMRFEFGGDPEETAMRMAARIRSELHEQAVVSRRTTRRRPPGDSTKKKKKKK
jgi:hypothetical protein